MKQVPNGGTEGQGKGSDQSLGYVRIWCMDYLIGGKADHGKDKDEGNPYRRSLQEILHKK